MAMKLRITRDWLKRKLEEKSNSIDFSSDPTIGPYIIDVGRTGNKALTLSNMSVVPWGTTLTITPAGPKEEKVRGESFARRPRQKR